MDSHKPPTRPLAPRQISCEDLQQELLAGLLPADHPHLESCAACTELARDLEQLARLARDLPRPPLPLRRPKTSGRLQLAPALAAGLFLVLGLGLFWRWAPVEQAPPPARAPSRVVQSADIAEYGDHQVDLLAALAMAQATWADRYDIEPAWTADLSPRAPTSPDEPPTWSQEDLSLQAERPSSATPAAEWGASVALVFDPLGSLAEGHGAWSAPEIFEHI